MLALTAEQLLAWLGDTTHRWMHLFEANPAVLALSCDIGQVESVAQLVQHIVAVELRYAERLSEQAPTDYANIPCDAVACLLATHERATDLLRPLLDRGDAFWDETIAFHTRSMGPMQAKRRTVLVHLAMHAVRHYAQLATLVRQHGISPGWAMDYLFQEATPTAVLG